VNQRCAAGHGFLECDHRRQGIEVGINEFERVFRLVAAAGHDCRHDLADEPHTVGCDDWPVRRQSPRRAQVNAHRGTRALEVGAGEHRDNARRPARHSRIDAVDARARQRAAEHCDVEMTLGLQVVDEPSPTAQ
jgi:hypothetical protein